MLKGTSFIGSADLLEAAGVYLNLTPVQVARCIDSVGIGVLNPANMERLTAPGRNFSINLVWDI